MDVLEGLAEGLTSEGLRSAVAELLGVAREEIADDDNLFELGLDSVRMMVLVNGLQQHGVELQFVELAERPTLAEWWRLVEGAPRADG
ncbi:phosphopantetheine-binding protein [Streptoalloteichus hindustanus]|uniref:Aryl carrier domain-containing protein n=1 Tax=Streptoalloteichus hindustanus TaxID=2017 RepID=A0A1M5L6Y6_STRHI|nr:phosphopantetheine-binding protein [Streptoalloteichus hindustanus]SHG60675.1 Aryl carrier domain-containing protein [Streptoalloteichus hindustanus]